MLYSGIENRAGLIGADRGCAGGIVLARQSLLILILRPASEGTFFSPTTRQNPVST